MNHELDIDGCGCTLHLFFGLPRSLCPSHLFSRTCYGILLVFILYTCCSQFFWQCSISHRIFRIFYTFSARHECTRVYQKVSGLVAWSENCKWYNSLPLGAVISLFFFFWVSLVSFEAIILCTAAQRVLSTQSGNFWTHPRMSTFLCVVLSCLAI
jgi:hypothetical protein